MAGTGSGARGRSYVERLYGPHGWDSQRFGWSAGLLKPRQAYFLVQAALIVAIVALFARFGLEAVSMTAFAALFVALAATGLIAGAASETDREPSHREHAGPVSPNAAVGERHTGLLASAGAPSDAAGLSSLHQLTARMSHDLRTPLNAVIGFSELMEREVHGPVGDARYRQYAAHIQASGLQLLRATEDTIAVTELIAGRPQASGERCFDIVAALRGCIAQSAHTECDTQALQALIGERAAADPAAFRAAFTRLLSAWQNCATPLRLAVCEAAAGERIHIGLEVVGASRGTAPAPTPYPQPQDDFRLCLLRTAFEIQGMGLSWQCDAAGSLVRVDLAIPRATQGELPLL